MNKEQSPRNGETQRDKKQESKIGRYARNALIFVAAAGILVVGANAIEKADYNAEVKSEQVGYMQDIKEYTLDENKVFLNGNGNINAGPYANSEKNLGKVGKDTEALYVLEFQEGAVVKVRANEHDPNGRFLGVEAQDINMDTAPPNLKKALEKDKTGEVWINIDQNVDNLDLGDEVKQ